ncbi:MAG: hypothetical protein HOO93_18650 [Methyloglobulus sp.]|nr:hypothetical protein [Methyloglobulus sp.]
MSTKSTLVYGPGFHLYHECFEPDNVFLELEKAHFECYPDSVTVAIPVVVWEVIRQSAGADFSWAAKSDNEIQSFVEQEVHGRITAFQDEDSRSKRFLFVDNSVFGLASEPRENQIENGVAYYFGERDRQRKLFEQIQDLVAKHKAHR